MEKIKIKSSKISGEITPPPSKSQTLRALIFALLAKGKTTIYNYLPSPDIFAMIEAIKNYGAKVKIHEEKLEIISNGKLFSPKNIFIDAKNSGIILRFIGAIAALNKNSYSIITGDDSIKKNRVILPLINGLRQLDIFYADFLNKDNRPPIIIKGPIKPNKIKVSGEDSQPISALLIACAFSTGISEIFVENPGEKPWIDLTLSWFDYFNIKYIKNSNYSYYKIFGNAQIKGFEYKIPSDFSSISYPIVAALISDSTITINNIDFNQIGGDKKLIFFFKEIGANIEIDNKNKTLKVKKGLKLKSFKIDVNDFIDALPLLAVLGCFAEGTSVLYNGKIARYKESDRIHAITQELKKMGANIKEIEDGIIIKKSILKDSVVHSHSDHRIALSLCIAALKAQNETIIEDISCIKKSFPTFFTDIKKLGISLSF